MTTQAKYRPILFNGPMVRAVLDGRKTQTRRIVTNINPEYLNKHCSIGSQYWELNRKAVSQGHPKPCPFGSVGDRLWVRESMFIDDYRCLDVPPRDWPRDVDQDSIYYRVDGNCCEQIPECICATEGKPKWTPSTHMPRWASRITLEITGVRVERLNEISNEDCVAEGITANGKGVLLSDGSYAQAGSYERKSSTVRQLYSELWESINGPNSWAANPWVWVVSFKRVEE